MSCEFVVFLQEYNVYTAILGLLFINFQLFRIRLN